MNPATPTISVLIPLYNGARYVRETLDSVLTQSVPVSEIVVVDDGSTDDGPAIVESVEKVRLVQKPHSGPAATLNRAFTEARGEVLAFVDADDLWTPGKLERQLAVLTASSSPLFVFGHAKNFHSPDLTDDEKARIHCPPDPIPAVTLGTMLARRTDVLRVGDIGTQWQVGYFVDWYSRAQALGIRAEMLPDVLLHRRLHRTNLSRTQPQARPDFARILKSVLDRKRAAGSSPASDGALPTNSP